VVSVNALNLSAAELVVVLPMTTRAKGIRSHVGVGAGEAGLETPGFIKCEDIRSLSTRRLGRRLGSVSESTQKAVEERLRMLLGL
jgi:mRNA interferase MazF